MRFFTRITDNREKERTNRIKSSRSQNNAYRNTNHMRFHEDTSCFKYAMCGNARMCACIARAGIIIALHQPQKCIQMRAARATRSHPECRVARTMLLAKSIPPRDRKDEIVPVPRDTRSSRLMVRARGAFSL